MHILKKQLRKSTFFINGGEELESFRDVLAKNSLSVLMGYDESYKDDKTVNTGYVHYEKGFYLSKNSFDKNVLTTL
jgi:hypothetical protein